MAKLKFGAWIPTYAWADRSDHAARFMAGDHRSGSGKAQGSLRAGRAIDVQIRAAHARSFDCDHDFARAW